MKLGKKGQVFEQLGSLGVGIAVLAITLVIAFLIMSQGKTQILEIEDFCSGTRFVFNSSAENCVNVTNSSQFGAANLSAAWNSTTTLQQATDDIPGWVPLIVIAVIGALLLGLVALFRR